MQIDWPFIVLFGGLVAFLLAEMQWPRLPETEGTAQRWLSNLSLTFLNHVLLGWLAPWAYALVAHLHLVPAQGLLSLQPFWLSLALTVILLELLQYSLHRLLHTVPWLWRLHAVHHCDLAVDVTTAHRHHPLEALFSFSFTLPVLLLLAPAPDVVLTASLVQITLALWSHSNLYLPETLDRWLRYLIVTPDFHRLHHHSEQRYTDSNYSLALPWFDYLFGTASRVPFAQQARIRLGLEYFRDRADARLTRLLLLPFIWHK